MSKLCAGLSLCKQLISDFVCVCAHELETLENVNTLIGQHNTFTTAILMMIITMNASQSLVYKKHIYVPYVPYIKVSMLSEYTLTSYIACYGCKFLLFRYTLTIKKR